MSAPLKATKTSKARNVLLAGTILPALAIPQWSMAFPFSSPSEEGTIILAQGGPNDPKEKDKAKQQPKGAPPPKAAPPPAAQPQRVQPPPAAALPKGPPPGPPPGAAAPQPRLQPPPAAALPKGPPPGAPPAAALPKGPPPGAPPAAALPKGPPPGAPPAAALPKGPPPGAQPAPGAAGLPKAPPPAAAPGQPQPRVVQPPPAAAGLPKAPAPAVGLPNAATPQPPQGAQPRQFGRPAPGVVQPATPGPQSVATRAVLQPQGIASVDGLRGQRRERVETGGRVVIEEPGGRLIVREQGRAFIRHDDAQRFRIWGGPPRMEVRGAERYAYIGRPGGYQIITVTDGSGRMLRRIRRGPDGREIVLIDNRPRFGVAAGVGVGLAAGVILGLAAPAILIPRERYIVDSSVAPAPLLYETLEAPPLVEIERPYTLDEIRYNVELRDRMRRIDIDTITFDTGSWEVTPEQQPKLQAIGEAVSRILANNPDEMFLIEGHTDAVGSDVDNLSLSDRRAELVAVVLTEVYQIPPENLVSQGYGEQYLKVPTDGPSRENRRASLRRITPLLQGGIAAR